MSDIYQFERIAVDVLDDIRSGLLNPGDALPAIKEWQTQYGVGYYTVRQARLLLKRKMYVEKCGKTLCVTSMAPYL